MKKHSGLILIAFNFFLTYLVGQPATTLIKVIVASDHNDWLYKPNELAKFSVSVLKDGSPG